MRLKTKLDGYVVRQERNNVDLGDIAPKIFCLGQIPSGQIYNIRNF
jgi:hypothetical protein